MLSSFRKAVPLQNYPLPIPALPAPRAVPSRSAVAKVWVALPQQYNAEQNQRGVMLNLAMPLPRKVQPRNALPLLNRSLLCHAITLLNTSMPLLRFARPCPCGFIRNRTMPLRYRAILGKTMPLLRATIPHVTLPQLCKTLFCPALAMSRVPMLCLRASVL